MIPDLVLAVLGKKRGAGGRRRGKAETRFGFSFNCREPRFLKQNATRYQNRCLYCLQENKSDLEHAQLIRGPDSGPRNRILPDLDFKNFNCLNTHLYVRAFCHCRLHGTCKMCLIFQLYSSRNQFIFSLCACANLSSLLFFYSGGEDSRH